MGLEYHERSRDERGKFSAQPLAQQQKQLHIRLSPLLISALKYLQINDRSPSLTKHIEKVLLHYAELNTGLNLHHPDFQQFSINDVYGLHPVQWSDEL